MSTDTSKKRRTKPDGPCARASDYTVVEAPFSELVPLVRRFHYAKSCGNTATHAHALVRVSDGAVVGAALWLPPTAGAAKGLAKRLLQDESRHREVLALSRLVVADGEPKNAASILLGGSERLVWEDDRWSLLVTYADLSRHTGTIYRATNWTHDGEARPRTTWVHRETGHMTSAASGQRASGPLAGITRRRTAQMLREAGYVVDRTSAKARFVKVRRA